MDVCAALLNVGTSGVTTDSSALQLPGTTLQAYNSTFNPTSGQITANSLAVGVTSWINPVWELISSAFVRYRIRKMIFEYMPQAASTTDDQLVFAFANDPLHPIIGINQATPAALTNQELLGMADSVPFMPWREWSLDVTDSYKGDQPLFVSRTGSLSTVGDEAATWRFSEGGVFALTNAATSTTRKTYGVLYLHSEIEFEEFCPILPFNVSALQNRNTGVPPKEEIARLRKEAGLRPPQIVPCEHSCCQDVVCVDCEPVAPQSDLASKNTCCDEEGEPGFQVIRISKDPTYTERHERTGTRGIDSISGNLGRKPSLLTATRRE